MNAHGSEALHLDVERFAEQAQQAAGSWSLPALTRLVEAAHPDRQPTKGDPVDWEVRGERRNPCGEGRQTWLHLSARTRLALVCQRCLQPLDTVLDVQRSFRFVEGEDAAARLDAESEDDVLASSRALDVLGWIEDELLLALPLIPRHEDCRMLLEATVDADMAGSGASENAAESHPFAALAALKAHGGVN